MRELVHVHIGTGVGRVHLGGFGVKDQCGAGLLAELAVAIEIARVALQILGRTKLRGVHEVGHDNAVVLGRSAHDQALVALVQKSHGGNESDRQAFTLPCAHLLADLGDGSCCLHH